MVEDLEEQPGGQVPEVPGAHLLHIVASRVPAEDGVDSMAKVAQERAPLGGGIALLAPLRRKELDGHALRQLFLSLERPVPAVPDGEPAGEPETSPGKTGSSWASAGGTERRATPPGRKAREVHTEPAKGALEQRGDAQNPLAAEGF